MERTLRFRLFSKLILFFLPFLFLVNSTYCFAKEKLDDLFFKVNSLKDKGCKTSKLMRINSVNSDSIVLSGRRIRKNKVIKVYGDLKVGNYAVIAKCNNGLILIIFPGGPNGPEVY